jgi:hypothetical protein
MATESRGPQMTQIDFSRACGAQRKSTGVIPARAH